MTPYLLQGLVKREPINGLLSNHPTDAEETETPIYEVANEGSNPALFNEIATRLSPLLAGLTRAGDQKGFILHVGIWEKLRS